MDSIINMKNISFKVKPLPMLVSLLMLTSFQINAQTFTGDGGLGDSSQNRINRTVSIFGSDYNLIDFSLFSTTPAQNIVSGNITIDASLPIPNSSALVTITDPFQGLTPDLKVTNTDGQTGQIKFTFNPALDVRAVGINIEAADFPVTFEAYSSNNTLLGTIERASQQQGANFTGYAGIKNTSTSISYFLIKASLDTNAETPIYDWIWLDNLIYVLLSGPSLEDTQASMQLSANRLRGIYSLQTSALINGLSYDCQVFDLNNICLSTGGRYSNNSGASGNTTSALLIGAYRFNKNIRVGAWVDQNLSTNTISGVNLGNSKPLFGVFGAWAENPTGEGYEVKVSAGYGDKDLTVTRDVVSTSEAGVGTSKLNSQAISSVSSYGFRINNELLASPYVGIRYSRIASNGYTESAADMTSPLTYNKLTLENVALMAGVRLSAKLDPKTTFVASAGFEQNLKNRSGQYSATGVDGLTPIEFNSNPQKTRATASIGAYYDVDKKQRVAVNGIYREETFSPTATTVVLATYTVGF